MGFVVPAAVCREVQYPQSRADSLPRDGDSPQSSPQLAGDSPQFGDGSPQSDRLTGLSDEVLALLPLTLVPHTGNGKNALDFHLSFYLGYVAARHPDATLVVVANDKGYDAMLSHAKLLGFTARRVGFKASKA